MLRRILLITVISFLTACSAPENDEPAAQGDASTHDEALSGEAHRNAFLDSFVQEAAPRLEKLATELSQDLFLFSFGFPEVHDKWEKYIEEGHNDFPIGAFTLRHIEDSTVVLTQDSLAGATYLIVRVFANVDEQQFAYYHLLHNKFAGNGLHFVFLFHQDEDNTATWKELQAAELSLPGFVARLDEAKFENRGLFREPQLYGYNEYLVDSEGMVIASGTQTRSIEFLYWTLQHVFDS